MPLTDPKLYYRTLRDAILKLLRDNKVTLNTNLTQSKFTNDNQIRAGHPSVIPVNAELYPAILVKVIKKDEAFSALGNAGRKRPIITFNLWGIINNPKFNMDADNEIMQLATNVEGLFRNNINIDSSTLYAMIGLTDFGVSELYENGQYLDIFSVDISCIVEIK